MLFAVVQVGNRKVLTYFLIGNVFLIALSSIKMPAVNLGDRVANL